MIISVEDQQRARTWLPRLRNALHSHDHYPAITERHNVDKACATVKAVQR